MLKIIVIATLILFGIILFTVIGGMLMFNSRLNKIESKVDITYKKAILNSDKCTDYLYYLNYFTVTK